MAKEKYGHNVNVHVTDELFDRIAAASEREERSVSAFCRFAVKRYLAELEATHAASS